MAKAKSLAGKPLTVDEALRAKVEVLRSVGNLSEVERLEAMACSVCGLLDCGCPWETNHPGLAAMPSEELSQGRH